MIFLRINLPNSVQFKQYWSKIVSMIEGLGEGATPSKHPPETSGPGQRTFRPCCLTKQLTTTMFQYHRNYSSLVSDCPL